LAKVLVTEGSWPPGFGEVRKEREQLVMKKSLPIAKEKKGGPLPCPLRGPASSEL